MTIVPFELQSHSFVVVVFFSAVLVVVKCAYALVSVLQGNGHNRFFFFIVCRTLRFWAGGSRSGQMGIWTSVTQFMMNQ